MEYLQDLSESICKKMFFAYKMKIVKQISVKLCNTPVDLNDHSSVNMWNILLFLEKNFGIRHRKELYQRNIRKGLKTRFLPR